jgi:hypothetical protein
MRTLRRISLILWLTLTFAAGGCSTIFDTAVGTGINAIDGRKRESVSDQMWREFDENRNGQ